MSMIRVAKLFLDLQQTFIHTRVIFFVAYLHLSLVLLVETLSFLHEKLEPKVIVATSINPELVRALLFLKATSGATLKFNCSMSKFLLNISTTAANMA